MPANWSLILNILLLIGVVVAIGRLMKARRQSLSYGGYQPGVGKVENSPYDVQPLHDDIIAVRKVNHEPTEQDSPRVNFSELNKASKRPEPRLIPQEEEPVVSDVKPRPSQRTTTIPPTVMMFLLAKENRQFAGYELLQTILACGLRFGEGNLFHRHQLANGEGAKVCSLAAATATGVFDLHNIGGFSTHGLCLFMQTSSDAHVNEERFAMMLETAEQLSEGLNAHLLDDKRRPLTTEHLARYYELLHLEQEELESEF